jgi:hypothetical protein
MEKTRDSWARFEKSGKLSDYLAFCEARRRERARKDTEERAERPDQSSL